MAKSSVTHSCGCTVIHNLVGNGSARDRKAEWLGRQSCWECEKKAASAAAAQAAASTGLPQLVGSEKQIAWAETIRKQQIDALTEAEKTALRGFAKASEAARLEVADALVLLRQELVACTAARDWIDSRDRHLSAQWIADQIIARHLAPTALAEIEQARAARKAAAEQH